ncbi:S1-like domain-containing RNA-binding protein [Bdellovibrio bacteriovorus]|uniref:Nucleic acid binding protein n=1 Tax=Bdellovibrio bacteriovorus (strain ATCC 15356 / DSM 50701 / NCIMB 9529 / HD100) TaxID=264462 RepID=Q6MN66_BDEBA|nr:S1-like domain-containing RNA-binding protein [Bdellovibrio bacteriovorus]CAE79286.1 nucleic acid binding protein [Bdellovibrio bacteriovorus HD100]
MVQIGQINKLKVVKTMEYGVFLDGGSDGEILLPARYQPEKCEVGDELEVFVCFDSEDRLVAMTEMPFAMVGTFGLLKVKSIERVGAFLDWGLPKDLFLPFSEQTRDLKIGQNVLVYLYLDNTDRISSSMRLERFIDKESGNYEAGQSVDLLIAAKTDLGYKAIINGRHWGMLYANEVFQQLEYGQRLKGFIKQVRDDGKIDLRLNEAGHKATADIGERIMELLKSKGGFLPITDKTDPEAIYDLFGVSKKKYKMALGGLYKKRLITVHDDGIRLAVGR